MIIFMYVQFTPPQEATDKIMLQDVGKLPALNGARVIRRPNQKARKESDDDYCRGVQWPMCLTAADISRDGKILIRNYEGKMMQLYMQIHSYTYMIILILRLQQCPIYNIFYSF